MYSVALAPIAVAAALCHHWYGCVNVPQWGALATGACLVIAWLNLSNDAWDAATGVDDSKPESVVRLLGGDESEDARKAAVNKVHAVALGCLALGVGGLCYAATQLAANATADVVYTVLAMLGAVRDKLVDLVVHWTRVGFCQGNFNSDNCLLAGRTLDYGPFGFMEAYDPRWCMWVGGGRHFAFNNQAGGCGWLHSVQS